MDDPTGIAGDVFEQLGQAGKGGQQTALDETRKIPAAIAGQLFGSSNPPEAEDPKELAKKQQFEEKKQKEKAQSEAAAQQIMAQLEEEMQKHRQERRQEEENYHNQQIAKAVPESEIEEKTAKDLPQPLEVQKSRAEKSAALRGE